MIEELIAKVFATRNAAHLAHLRTKSYAEHVALGSFYEGVIGAVDSLVEAHQGLFGLIDEVNVKSVKGDIAALLREDSDWIEANRNNIANGSDAVANLVDGITACYLSALYKIENLS